MSGYGIGMVATVARFKPIRLALRVAPTGCTVVDLGAASPRTRVFPIATSTRLPTAATTLVFVSRGLQMHSKNQSYGTSIPNTRGAAIPLDGGWYYVSRWFLAGRVWGWFVALMGGSS